MSVVLQVVGMAAWLHWRGSVTEDYNYVVNAWAWAAGVTIATGIFYLVDRYRS